MILYFINITTFKKQFNDNNKMSSTIDSKPLYIYLKNSVNKLMIN